MMGIWGKIFGTDEALKAGAEIAKEATGGIIAGLDAAFYTKEENVNDIKEVLFKLQDQYTPRSASRRILAVMFSMVFCLYCLSALGVILLRIAVPAVPSAEIVKMLIETMTAFELPWIMLTVVVFYFGYYGWKSVKEAKS